MTSPKKKNSKLTPKKLPRIDVYIFDVPFTSPPDWQGEQDFPQDISRLMNYRKHIRWNEDLNV